MLFQSISLLALMLASSTVHSTPLESTFVLAGTISGNRADGNSTQTNNMFIQRNATNLITNHINNTLNELNIKNFDNRVTNHINNTLNEHNQEIRIFNNSSTQIVQNIVNNYQRLIQAASQPGYSGPPVPALDALAVKGAPCAGRRSKHHKKKYLRLIMDARKIADESMAMAMELLQE